MLIYKFINIVNTLNVLFDEFVSCDSFASLAFACGRVGIE